MKRSILIVDYDNIGKYIYGEFSELSPQVYDPNISDKLNAARKSLVADNGASGRMYIGEAPEELKLESEIHRMERMRRLRAERIGLTAKTKFVYYCSLCLIIRDENDYLEEWLKWHIGQGVEHFYIYDHGSKYPVEKFVESLGGDISDKVTVVDWSGRHKDAQPEAYNHCLNKFRGESRWIGFVDADEQVRVKTGRALPELLKGYEDYAGLFAVWSVYDADGQVKQRSGPLRERFRHVNLNDEWANRAGKVFVQPFYMLEMVIHNGRPAEGFYIVDEHKKRVPNYSLTVEKATKDLICVDHYYTKSYEEWIKKIQRGSGHAKYQRKYDEFFKINTDMEYCRENIAIKQQYEHSEN